MVQLKMVEQNTQKKKKVLNVSSKDPWKKNLKKVQRDTKESKKKKSFNVAKKKKSVLTLNLLGRGSCR